MVVEAVVGTEERAPTGKAIEVAGISLRRQLAGGELARRGYDLILLARDQVRLARLANQLSADTGRKAEVLSADLTLKVDLHRVAESRRPQASQQ